VRDDVLLFAESPSRAVVTTRDDLRMAELARRHGVPWARIGVVGGDRLVLSAGGRPLVDLPVSTLHEAWMSLERQLAAPALSR
jgi:phosphoribosylformylglycinamidine (FGAM) synthase-like enzyme